MSRKVCCEVYFDEDTGDWYELVTHFEYETDDETRYRIYSGGEYIGNVRTIYDHMAHWKPLKLVTCMTASIPPVAILSRGLTKNGCF